jgi:DNA-binding IclR family transcriptional regulator
LHISVLGAVFFMPQDRLLDEDFLTQEIARHDADLDRQEVKNVILQARRSGMLDDRGMFFPGMRRFAVPLYESGQVVMTLGVGIMPARLEQDSALYERIISRLQSARTEIESFMS